MSILSETTYRAAAVRRDRVDSFAVIALTLSFVLALLGLVLTANPRADAQSDDTAVTLIGP
jgi:hypothetical protein